MDIQHIMEKVFVLTTILVCLVLAFLFGAIQAGWI